MDPTVHPQAGTAPAHLLPDAPWFLAYTKPRQELVAQLNLQHQAYHTYLPLFKALKKSTPHTDASGQIVFEPMFPRYVFFRPGNLRQSVAAARSTRGVNSIVSFGFEMATVPAQTLAAIRLFERRRNETDIQSINPFQSGDKVRLVGGGLQSLEGLVHSVSAQRVKLLLGILGSQKLVSVAHHQIELVA
jgi:transcriptional antiterminator RfaH